MEDRLTTTMQGAQRAAENLRVLGLAQREEEDRAPGTAMWGLAEDT